MSKISEDCINEAFEALKNFSKEELNEYIQNVFIRAKEIDPSRGVKAMETAEKEINEMMKKNLFSDAIQKARNINAFNLNSTPIQEGKADVRGILAGRTKKGSYWKKTADDSNWTKRNIPASVKAEYGKIVKRLFGDLSHEEVEKFSSGKFDVDICDAIDGKESNDPFIKKMADKFRDYWDYSKAELILSGAMKENEFHPRRYFKQVYDVQRIINASKSWAKEALSLRKIDLKDSKSWFRNLMNKFIDKEETFKRTKAADINGNIDQSEADKIIDKTFDNITTQKSEIFTRSKVINDREAVKRKSKIFYIWKNMRAQYEFNKQAGSGNLYAMLMRDAQSSAHSIGTAKVWGDNPFSMYLDLAKVQERVEPKGAKWWEHTDNYFNSVMRLDRTDSNPNATNFFANLRTLSSMARLPFITINSISDIGYNASFAMRHGVNYFKAWNYHLTHIFNLFPNEDRVRISKLFKANIDSHLGYMGRWTETNNVSDWLNKISTGFFKYNLLEAFDRGNKISAMTLLGKSLFEKSNVSFKSLPEQTQKYLSRFIDEKEWDLLRNKNNVSFFSTDNVDNISEQELRSHYEKTNKVLPYSELRDDLFRRVYAMFTTASENAVLSPGDFERAFLYQGTNTGSTVGIALRTITQFKMYSMAYIDRVLIDGLRNADSVQQKIMWATSLMMGTLPLSFMSTFFSYAVMNQTMPDPSLMNVSERERFLFNLLQPSLAMFSGLFDPRDQNARDMIFSLIGSPSVNLILNGLASPLALASGNPKHAAKQALKSASYFLPIQTTPIISPIIESAMGTEAKLQPGQNHIIGQ